MHLNVIRPVICSIGSRRRWSNERSPSFVCARSKRWSLRYFVVLASVTSRIRVFESNYVDRCTPCKSRNDASTTIHWRYSTAAERSITRSVCFSMDSFENVSYTSSRKICEHKRHWQRRNLSTRGQPLALTLQRRTPTRSVRSTWRNVYLHPSFNQWKDCHSIAR